MIRLIITEEIEAHDAKDFKKVTDERRDSFSNGTRPNLAGKATFKDPVGEMFHSYETSAPERVLDGLLPADRYSQISFDGFNDDEGVGKKTTTTCLLICRICLLITTLIKAASYLTLLQVLMTRVL